MGRCPLNERNIVKQFFIKAMAAVTMSLLSGLAFGYAQWCVREMSIEREKRRDIDLWKEKRLEEIRERRRELGLIDG